MNTVIRTTTSLCGQIAEKHGARGDRNLRMRGGMTILLEGEGLGLWRQKRQGRVGV